MFVRSFQCLNLPKKIFFSKIKSFNDLLVGIINVGGILYRNPSFHLDLEKHIADKCNSCLFLAYNKKVMIHVLWSLWIAYGFFIFLFTYLYSTLH